MSSLIQVRTEVTPTDTLSNIPTVNMAIKRDSPKFTNTDDRVGCVFKKDTFLFKLDDSSIAYNYAGMFTICFWCKFVDLGRTDEAYPNKIVLILEDGTTLDVVIPSTVDMTQYHWIKIQRDSTNEITFSIDGVTIFTQTETGALNLTSNSYLFIGNTDRYFTGYEVVCDDILIFSSALDSLDTVPTEYLDASNFSMLLYIKVSDGTVWGYKEEV